MGNIFTASKVSGKGKATSNITPSVWHGRLKHVELATGTTADAPNPSDVTTLEMTGCGERITLTEVYVGTKSIPGVGGSDNVPGLITPVAGVDIRVMFKSNSQGVAIASATGAIFGNQSLVCKIKRIGDAAYKYLTDAGTLSDTPAQIAHNFTSGMVHQISGDPGATDDYLVDLTFHIPENVMAENRQWSVSLGTSAAPGGFLVGGMQSGAAPKITLTPPTLLFSPDNLAAQVLTITSNDDWTLDIVNQTVNTARRLQDSAEYYLQGSDGINLLENH